MHSFPFEPTPAFQQTSFVFNTLDLFATPPPAFTTAEETIFLAGFADAQERLDDAVESDRSKFTTFQKSLGAQATTFTLLAADARQAYLTMWVHSRLGIRRRYYTSVKTLVMVAAYSMNETWNAIGYPGPLLAQPSSARKS